MDDLDQIGMCHLRPATDIPCWVFSKIGKVILIIFFDSMKV